MKKSICLIIILSFVFSCKTEEQKIRRFTKDGVEVILNNVKPYKIKSEPVNLALVEDFSIDTENPEIAAKGLMDIFQFDIDSSGDIYFLVPIKGEGNFIHKYRRGDFVTSFGRKGQGPGELQWPYPLRINNQDEIMVGEPPNKLLFFSKEGTFLRQTTVSDVENLQPLKNGKYLAFNTKLFDPKQKYNQILLSLFSSDFRETKELDRFNMLPNQMLVESISEKYISGIEFVFIGNANDKYIYTGNSERGYVIWVYDLEGHLVRKIEKDYRPLKVSEDYKKEYMKPYEDTQDPFMKVWSEKIYFPRHWHPFQSFFPDEEGRLYVMTYEKGLNENEFMFDIFSSEGVFITRKSMNIYHSSGGISRQVHAKCQNKRLYVIQENEKGFKRFAVYQLLWE